MKNFIITALFAALPFAGFAQSEFDQFQNVEGIESVSINGNFFDMAESFKDEAKDEKAKKCLSMVKSIDNLKILTTSKSRHVKSLKKAVASYLKNDALEQMMSVNSDGTTFKIYVKEGATANLLKEGLIFVEGKDDKLVVITFTGNIDLNGLKNIQ